MTTINQYQNGNTTVTLYDDGTKIREYENIPKVVFPESIDVKITDYCDLGCSYCHESSTRAGIHGDLDELLKVLSVLPAGIEIAIGGGNPLSHPNLIEFLVELKRIGIIANITVNQGHLKTHVALITYLQDEGLIKAIGISITSNNFTYVNLLENNNTVFHVISGVNKIDILDQLIGEKVLILGYKQFGFGIKHYSEAIEKEIRNWYMYLPKYLGKIHLSFDNLAIEQLNVKRFFTEEGWNKFYMGDDFQFTMYIDAVKQEYAPTSRSKERKSFSEVGLLEYFRQK